MRHGSAFTGWWRPVLLVLAVAFVGHGAAPSSATADLPYVSGPGSMALGWTQPLLVVPEGTSVTYTNLDVAVHDVVALVNGPDEPYCADRFPPGECPLVFSAAIGIAESTPVFGMNKLKAGWQVPFRCTLHDLMRGTIVVVPASA